LEYLGISFKDSASIKRRTIVFNFLPVSEVFSNSHNVGTGIFEQFSTNLLCSIFIKIKFDEAMIDSIDKFLPLQVYVLSAILSQLLKGVAVVKNVSKSLPKVEIH
jgi:hypothetical protein